MRKVAMKRLYNHQHKKHSRDSNNNPKEDMRDISDWVIWPNLVADPAADYKIDTNSTKDSEDEFCMEFHCNDEWVWN
jgi:hypothetical protein